MPTYLSPGVYVEEAQSASRPIEGVGTAVAAFIGLAEKGSFNEPTLVTNWNQFTSNFGEFVDGSYLAHSVYAYFQNGGGAAYIVRVGEDGATSNGHGRGAGNGRQQQALPSGPQAALGNYVVRALDGGVPSGAITVEVAEAGGEAPSEDMFKVVV